MSGIFPSQGRLLSLSLVLDRRKLDFKDEEKAKNNRQNEKR